MMKTFTLSLVAALLNSPRFASGEKLDNVRAIGKDAVIKGGEISWDSGKGWRDSFTCNAPRALSISADKKWAACCEDSNSLKGSDTTEFQCCAAGHDLAGSKATGFNCCPTGQDFDGKVCKLVCKNGKNLVDGKCVCPEGYVEAAGDTCTEKPDQGGCTSGLTTGKCYMFKGETGRRLAFRNNQYSETIPHKDAIPGKFQLCRDQKCTPGMPINPSHEIHIKDLHGTPPNSADAGQWLNNAAGGAHIGKTPDYAKSGNFSITRWPCGKYCLSGVQRGLGMACPSEDPSITFYGSVTEACVEYDLLEVPCKIRDNTNNCIWKNGKNQCCSKTDCSDAGAGDKPGGKPGDKPDPTGSAPPEPTETKSPMEQLCPSKHDTTIEAFGVGFRILCGWQFKPDEKVDTEKNVLDPLSCHAKCAKDKNCQGANWDMLNLGCSCSKDWAAAIVEGNFSYVTFHPTFPRPI
ncbi:hypothetical protein CDD82_2548 [Ophiocordyceps australis]|uniref:WSC domain-containing protein n=1 Tax=Ophiocordyceps australis TaxID=1399860 RepID=A0A2C5ZIF8_9HYPO|nr:hypothetical protein CDD82_2548 [Ophiocordyceps australis]